MLNKLKQLANRYEELKFSLTKPELVNNPAEFSKLSKEFVKLEPVNQVYTELNRLQLELKHAKELLEREGDKQMLDMVKEEIVELTNSIAETEDQAKIVLIPKDVKDEGDAIIEIRAGAGGDEASLFVADLARMYRGYAASHKLSVSVIDVSHGLGNGYKEIVLQISGNNAFRLFKYEAGTHRVQRVPDTEAQGRVHTSTVTVAVLPVKSEVEAFIINPSDLKVDTYRSQGAGGQHVNTTDSAVRITHIPTGVVVACQEERSQHKNRAKAMAYLQAKLNEMEIVEQAKSEASLRKEMVGTGDRSEKIRTYNYQQGRISDHRIKITIYKLEEVMNTGGIDEIVDGLLMQEQLLKLENLAV